MSKICTPAEIEEKKRIAQEKLLQKRRLLHSAVNASNGNNTRDMGLSSGGCGTSTGSPVKSKFFSTRKTFAQAGSAFCDSPPKKKLNTYQQQQQQRPGNFATKDVQFNTGGKITATLIMISNTRFQVKLSKYFNIAVDLMKTVPSKCYDPKTTYWNFALKDYDLLLSKLENLKTHLVVHRLPKWIHVLKKPKTEGESCYDFSIIDEELRDTLMPFQEESLCFAIDREGRCFLADEMGLGKTIQALAIAAYYREDWPILIVTPASTCANWENTICKYLPSVPIMNIQLLSSRSDYIDRPAIVITSYDMMTRRVDELAAVKFGVCIFDESHTLKNFKTKCFKSALTLAKIAKRVVLLSGTPALSKPSELFTQLQLIDDAFFGTFMDFSKRYCDAKESAFGWDSSGQSNLDELKVVLEERFMIRRTKQCLSALQLPDKQQEIIQLDMRAAQMSVEEQKAYDRLQGTDFKQVIKNDSQILPFFHNTAKIKIPAVQAYLRQILNEETRKFIIFAHHMNMLDAMTTTLNQQRTKFVRIDGKTTDRARQVRSFQTDEDVRCAVLSITAANAGITLTAANLVIFTELHWTPSILAQAEARVHRIGQTHPVTIRYLIAPKTVDDYIWPMLKNKQQTLKEMQLTTDSYDNYKTVSKPAVANNNITNYFSPSKRAHQESLAESSDSKRLKSFPEAKPCSEVSTQPNELEDDDLDDFFRNYSTQKLVCKLETKEPSESTSVDDDIFNDGLDEYFKTIEYE